MSYILLVLSLALIFLAFDMQRLAKKSAKKSGVQGSVLYTDADHEKPVEMLKADIEPGIGMMGKPDYIVKATEGIVPVEYKSSKAPGRLWDTYINQVGAYFILIKEKYNSVSPYGTVVFSDGKKFKVENSDKLRETIIHYSRNMRDIKFGVQEAIRNHNSQNKCRSCEFSPVCDQRVEI